MLPGGGLEAGRRGAPPVAGQGDGAEPAGADHVEDAGIGRVLDRHGVARPAEGGEGEVDGVLGAVGDVDLLRAGGQPGGGVAPGQGRSQDEQPGRVVPVRRDGGQQIGRCHRQRRQLRRRRRRRDPEVDPPHRRPQQPGRHRRGSGARPAFLRAARPCRRNAGARRAGDPGGAPLAGADEAFGPEEVEGGDQGGAADGQRLGQEPLGGQDGAGGQEVGQDPGPEREGQAGGQRARPPGGPVAEQGGDVGG